MYVGTHCTPFFGTLGNLNDATCAQYGRNRLRSVKRETVEKEQSALRRLLRWCEEQGIMSKAPAVPSLPRKATGTPYKVRRRGKATELSPEEVQAVVSALPERSESPRVAPFPIRTRFIVEFETALRPATLSELSVPENYRKGATVCAPSRG